MSNNRIEDLLIIDTLFAPLNKKAQLGASLSSIFDTIKNYVGEHIEKGKEAESIINILTPGILWGIHPFLGLLVKIAEGWFGFSPGDILMSVVNKIKPYLTSAKQITSDQIDGWTKEAVEAYQGPDPTQSDVDRITSNALLTLRDAQLYKIAAYNFEKEGQVVSGALQLLGLKRKTSSIIGMVISFFIKAVLAAAGLMVAGDLASKVISPSSNKDSSSTPSLPASTQTLFKVNPSYVEEKFNIGSGWIETVPPSQIADPIAHWAGEIYPDLQGKTNFIKSNPVFQAFVTNLQKYNITNKSNVTFMPKKFHSKKEVVDMFIDSLADKINSSLPVPNVPAGEQDKNPHSVPA